MRRLTRRSVQVVTSSLRGSMATITAVIGSALPESGMMVVAGSGANSVTNHRGSDQSGTEGWEAARIAPVASSSITCTCRSPLKARTKAARSPEVSLEAGRRAINWATRLPRGPLRAAPSSAVMLRVAWPKVRTAPIDRIATKATISVSARRDLSDTGDERAFASRRSLRALQGGSELVSVQEPAGDGVVKSASTPSPTPTPTLASKSKTGQRIGARNRTAKRPPPKSVTTPSFSREPGPCQGRISGAIAYLSKLQAVSGLSVPSVSEFRRT